MQPKSNGMKVVQFGISMDIHSCTVYAQRGPGMRYSAPGFLRNQTAVWIGDLGTRTKNPRRGWFRPENRNFVLFSAVGYSAEDFLTL